MNRNDIAVVKKIFEQHYYRMTKEGFVAYRWPRRVERDGDPMLKITVHPKNKTLRFQYRDFDSYEKIPVYYLMTERINELFEYIEERANNYMNMQLAGDNLLWMKFIKLNSAAYYHVYIEPGTHDTLSVTVKLDEHVVCFNFHGNADCVEIPDEIFTYLTASKINQDVRRKYLDRREQYFSSGVCKNKVPIPQGAYNIAMQRWGVTADVAYNYFMLEVEEQCKDADVDVDIISAISHSNNNAVIPEHYTYNDRNIDVLQERGFYGTKAFYSLTGNKYTFKDRYEADRYINALLNTSVQASMVGHSILGLAFIYLLELYMIRNHTCENEGGRYGEN